MERYNSYSLYLLKKYGVKVYRVGVDAGFSCPNRGSDRSRPGCLYCDETGSRAPYLDTEQDIKKQILGGIDFLKKRYGAQGFILYFQAFSGTFASVGKLRQIYDFGLSLHNFRELIISTRPDCINGPVIELLKTYKKPERDVWIELGLQSAHDETLERINRGHTVADFEKAFTGLRNAGVKVAVHLILGLEGDEKIYRTLDYVAALQPDGVKLHNLHIPAACPLYREFLNGEITVPSPQKHIQYCIRALEILPPETVIMRLTCDTPRGRLAFPGKFWKKAEFYRVFRTELERRDIIQGRMFKGSRSL